MYRRAGGMVLAYETVPKINCRHAKSPEHLVAQ
jgi:hypothetical protein